MLYLFYAAVVPILLYLIFGLIRYERGRYYRQERLANRTAQLKQKYTLDDEKQAAVNSFIDYCKEEYNKRQDDK